MIRVAVSPRIDGERIVIAVIPSTDVTARRCTGKIIKSGHRPLTRRCDGRIATKAARYHHKARCLRIGSIIDRIASRRMISFSRVISPGQRNREGLVQGRVTTEINDGGRPSSRPSSRTFVLKEFRAKGSTQFQPHLFGQDRDVVVRFDS